MMKITNTGIEFPDFLAFKSFVTEYELLGSVSLSEPIIDKSGTILLKEKIVITEHLVKKLETMDGKFIPSFKLGMSRDLMKMLKLVLSKAVLARIDDRTNEFIRHLYDQNPEKLGSLRGTIMNSFFTKSLALAFFRILLNHREFFNHLADLGLLCLGSVFQKKYPFKMVNRFSFLAGMCVDISTSKDETYKRTLIGSPLSITTSLSMEISRNFGLPEEVLTAMNSHPIIEFEIPGATLANVSATEFRQNQLNQDLLTGDKMDDESLDDEEEGNEYSGAMAEVVLESLKIARFIMENLKVSSDREHLSEKLLVMFTYNTEKGMFKKDLADPMLDRFVKFDQAIKKIRTIAEIENRCKFPPSAWAYPKPKASQVLCKGKHYQCPWIVNGWDLKIITQQDPFGYIGTSLKVGTYPKCALEEELQKQVRPED